MDLVGRAGEQAAIAGLLEAARQGRSGVLALVGEPGIGKSALLEYAVGQATGMSVLRARGVQSEARIPFAGLSELLRPALHCLDLIPAPQADALRSSLALAPSRAEDRFAVGAATLSLLAAFAEDRPLLIVVDDAHWVDGSSADALSFALRRLVVDPVAALVAVRLGRPSLLDGADLPRLHVGGLGPADASVLVGTAAGALPEDVADRLYRQTGGNPLALLEAGGQIDRFRHGAPLDTPLPVVTSLTDVYVGRIRALGPSARMVALLAAASDTAEVAALARAATLVGADIADIAQAEAAGLADIRAGRVEFRHPLIRSAVYGDAGPVDRRRAHRALADTLPDAEADRRAWHLALASLGPDDTACTALEQAALRARARNGFDVAARAFDRASELAPEEPRRARLLYQAADAAWSAGQSARAVELIDEAQRHVPAPEVEVAIDHLRGQVASRHGPARLGLSTLMSAADRAAGTDPERAIIILADAINAAFFAGDARSMRDAAARIARLEPGKRSPKVAFFAVMAQGMALTFSGDSSQSGAGTALLRDAVGMALRAQADAGSPAGAGPGAAASTEDPRWLIWAAMGSLWVRESDDSRALIERATEVARSRSAVGALPYLLSHVAIDLATTDRWAEAEATFHEVIDLAREAGQRTDLAAALSRLAWLEARLGKEDLCRAHAAEAIDLSNRLGLRLCHIFALAALGDLGLATGATAEAIAHLEHQQRLLEECEIEDVDLSPAPELAELHLRLGAVGTAAALASAYHARAESKGQPWAMARAGRTLGLLAEETEVDGIFQEALAAHRRTPDLFETGRTHLAYGSRLRRVRQRARSREQLRAAIAIFDALGAGPWSATARAELAATGETARRRDAPAREQLTPQELQIALLLAAKHTTREAAAALFLSPKTVDYHLRNIYRKLGCSSREDLAALLSSSGAGLAPP